MWVYWALLVVYSNPCQGSVALLVLGLVFGKMTQVLTLLDETRPSIKVDPVVKSDLPHIAGMKWFQTRELYHMTSLKSKVTTYTQLARPKDTISLHYLPLTAVFYKGMLQSRFLSHCIARTARRSPQALWISKLTPPRQLPNTNHPRRTFSSSTINMSGFSNADTGSKNADPYTQKNLEEPSLKEKVEDLLNFVDKTKFCLLTTQVADSDLLASRAMALAAKVRNTG